MDMWEVIKPVRREQHVTGILEMVGEVEQFVCTLAVTKIILRIQFAPPEQAPAAAVLLLTIP